MFESCNTLLELNQARMSAIRAGNDVHSVNSSYNTRKKEIMQKSKSYRVISIHRAPTAEATPLMPLPIIGTPDEPNMIEITPMGLKC